MRDELLSVIVPVYNTEHYLRECIDSILHQTYDNIEIILVDDGSTDGSAQICDEYSEKYDRIRCVHKKNEGACYARRDGVRIARGKYVGFVDSDDYIDAQMYATLMLYIERDNVEIVTSGFVYDNGARLVDLLPEGLYENGRLEEIYDRMIFDYRKKRNGILCSVCTKVYKKELLEGYLEEIPKDVSMWEDLTYTYRPFVEASKIQVTVACFYHYRQHQDSSTKRRDIDAFDKMIFSFRVAERLYSSYSESIQSQLRQLSCHCLLVWVRVEIENQVKVTDMQSMKAVCEATDNNYFQSLCAINKYNKTLTLPMVELVCELIRKEKRLQAVLLVKTMMYLRMLKSYAGKVIRRSVKR